MRFNLPKIKPEVYVFNVDRKIDLDQSFFATFTGISFATFVLIANTVDLHHTDCGKTRVSMARKRS